MKKFITFILCILLVCLMSFSVYADETSEITTETETTVGSAITIPKEPPEENAENTDSNTMDLLSVKFESWVLPNLEEISVVITLILTAFYNMRKHKLLNKSIGTMNNNTVAIAENSANMMSQAVSNISNTANIVTQYDARIAAMLDAHQATLEDKARLEKELLEIKVYLKAAAESNLEFSNELAELLGLANIPNYKKEEIGARHLAAVHSIKSAEEEALTHTEEVILNGKEDGAKA